MATRQFSMVAFGGSGNIERLDPFRPALEAALSEGRDMLERRGSAVLVAMRCAMILENHPRLNAGHGSALDAEGRLSMEAAIMNGADLSAGAVSGVDCVRNPIELADHIRRLPDIVKLIGIGAVQLAKECGMDMVDPETLITDRQRKRLARQLATGALVIDGATEGKMGTIGVVVKDMEGNLAAATSTGGLLGARVGRVADTSTIGAGTYADKRVAISCTGRGEDFIRTHAAGRVATYMELGHPLSGAVDAAIARIEQIQGKGGIIAIGSQGEVMTRTTSTVRAMPHGGLTSDHEIVISLRPSEVTSALQA